MRVLTNSLSLWRNRLTEKIVMPERIKGTILERWVLYWRGLFSDYAEVATGVVKESYAKPKKALTYATVGYTLYQLSLHNPDEEKFLRILRDYSNRMITVSTSLQNPVSADYLCTLERAVNRKQIRLLSLGICSLLWIDLYDEDECTYAATCDYTKVSFWDFHKHIVDIGLWDQFWRLKWKMHNYDINYI